MSVVFHENPFALNFYKLEYSIENKDLFKSIKNNSVVTIKCERNDQESLKEQLNIYKDKIVTSRVLLYDKEKTSRPPESFRAEASGESSWAPGSPGYGSAGGKSGCHPGSWCAAPE